MSDSDNNISPEIIISERDLNYIYSFIGAPFVEKDEIEFDLDAVKEYVILPCLWKYFTFFPIINKQSISVSGTLLKVPYPTPTTYGVAGVQVTKYGNTLPNNIGFGANVFNRNALMGNNTNRGYGTRYEISSRMSDAFTSRFTSDGFGNMFQVKHFRDIQDKREIEVFSNVPGIIEITFCEYSYNVSDIPFQRKHDFLEYCGSKLLLKIKDVRDMIVADFPVEFDLSDMASRAEDTIEKIEEKWNESSNAIVIR